MLWKILLASLALALAANPTTFRVRLAEDMGTLDWNYGELSAEVVYQLMEGLFRSDHAGQPVNAAARDYHWNHAHTALDVNLKPGLRWSDGVPLCAQHFVDSWNRLRSKEFASPYAHYAGMLKSYAARGCEKLHVEFTRPAPEAIAFLSHFVFFPIRLDALAKHPRMFTEGVSLPVNGPFRVSEWKLNAQLTLVRNENYSGPRPYLERVEYKFIPDDNTAKSMFELGQLDWVRDVAQLLRTKALRESGELRVFPALIVYYFGLNAGKAAVLGDANVRHALADSLDRAEIARLLGEEYRAAPCWVATELQPCRARPAAPVSAATRAALKAAKGLTLRVYAKAQHRTLAEWAQGQWEKKLGVRIPIEVEEGKVYWKEISVNPAPIFLSGVTAAYAHPRAFLQEFLSGGSANWTGWASPAYDAAVLAGDSARAAQILQDAGFVIPVYQRGIVALVQKRWQGFFINPLEAAYLGEVK